MGEEIKDEDEEVEELLSADGTPATLEERRKLMKQKQMEELRAKAMAAYANLKKRRQEAKKSK